jgi:hypothetical protein
MAGTAKVRLCMCVRVCVCVPVHVSFRPVPPRVPLPPCPPAAAPSLNSLNFPTHTHTHTPTPKQSTGTKKKGSKKSSAKKGPTAYTLYIKERCAELHKQYGGEYFLLILSLGLPASYFGPCPPSPQIHTHILTHKNRGQHRDRRGAGRLGPPH